MSMGLSMRTCIRGTTSFTAPQSGRSTLMIVGWGYSAYDMARDPLQPGASASVSGAAGGVFDGVSKRAAPPPPHIGVIGEHCTRSWEQWNDPQDRGTRPNEEIDKENGVFGC